MSGSWPPPPPKDELFEAIAHKFTTYLRTPADRAGWKGPLPPPSTRCYWNQQERDRLILGLRSRARYLVQGVYLFQHFDAYVKERRADGEKKDDVFWKVDYERPIDHVKIIAAIENHLKAELLSRGFIVHYIKKDADTRPLWDLQQAGQPVPIDDFLAVKAFAHKPAAWSPELEGLIDGPRSLSLPDLLKPGLAHLFNLEQPFVMYIARRLYPERNRIHCLLDGVRAIIVESHIEEWTRIRDYCHKLILDKPADP